MLFITGFDPKAEQSCIQMIHQNKLDGAIGLTYNPDLKVDEDIPFVTIDRHFSSTVPCVSSDNFGGGRLAAEKLTELGCRHLAFLGVVSPVPSEVDKRGDGFESYFLSFCPCKSLSHPCAPPLRDKSRPRKNVKKYSFESRIQQFSQKTTRTSLTRDLSTCYHNSENPSPEFREGALCKEGTRVCQYTIVS